MRLFRALVVDDDPWVRDLARDAHDPDAGVEVLTAADLDEAEALIAAHFFHVAFIDLQLAPGSSVNVDGQTVLNELYKVRPSCRRFLLTQYPTTYRKQLFELLDPDGPIIDGAVDKDEFGVLFVDYVRKAAEAWLRSPVQVQGLDLMHTALEGRGIEGTKTLPGEPAALTAEELDYVVSAMFGQGDTLDGHRDETEAFTMVDLTLLEGGKSGSAVAVAQLTSRRGATGIPCVVKIGSREETLEEVRRYDQYVRYRVALHRRVEVLKTVVADTVGGVCYSFAGQVPGDITDLQTLFDAEDPAAFGRLEQLFGPEADWAEERLIKRDLAGFFFQAYDLEADKSIKAVREIAQGCTSRFGATLQDDDLVFGGTKVGLIRDTDLGAAVLRRNYVSSVVHGDLNASNVIVTTRDGITLIDFRHTSRGPATIDYAGLQTSIRLSRPAWEGVVDDVSLIDKIERRLWAYDFTKSDAWWSSHAGEPPYWAQASAILRRLASTHVPEVTASEHAATCLLYALRVFRVRSIDIAAKLRLLVWISSLRRQLAAKSDAPRR